MVAACLSHPSRTELASPHIYLSPMNASGWRIGFGGSLLALTTLLAACGPEVVYEEEVALPGTWSYADSVSFAYDIGDTSRAYDLRLSLKHRDAFATQNLYTRFVTVYPDGRRQSEAVSLELADARGRWQGDCSGEGCELVIPLQDAARFPAAGRYGLVVHQYMREEAVAGVDEVGLMVMVAE